MALVWLCGGFEMALGGFAGPFCPLRYDSWLRECKKASPPGMPVEQSASRVSTPSRSARGSETRPVCSVRAAIWRRTDALVLAVNAGSMNVAARGPRANNAPHGTATSSRGSVQPVCWTTSWPLLLNQGLQLVQMSLLNLNTPEIPLPDNLDR